MQSIIYSYHINAIWGHSVIYGYDKDDCSYHMEWNTRECNRWGHSVINGYDKDDSIDTRVCYVMHSVIYGYDKDDYMMWNERGGNAMQWLKGMHPVGIPWHMNMMCNQLYIVTIWNETQGNAMLGLYEMLYEGIQ